MNTNASFLPAERIADSRGRECFRIPLTGADGAGRFALVDDAGLAALHDAGARQLYTVNDHQGRAYVRFVSALNRKVVTAARAICGEPRNRRVEYVSGDKLDLRRENLRVRDYEGVGEPRSTMKAVA